MTRRWVLTPQYKCTKITHMYKGKPKEHYEELAETLRQKFTTPRIRLTVRDVADTLGMASTSAAVNILRHLVEIKAVTHDPESGHYYLVTE